MYSFLRRYCARIRDLWYIFSISAKNMISKSAEILRDRPVGQQKSSYSVKQPTTSNMNQTRLANILLVVLIAAVAIAVPLKDFNFLAIYNQSCSSDGYLLEMNIDGGDNLLFVQSIALPGDCLFFTNVEYGYITLSRDKLSAVMPCCINQTDNPGKIGFIEIYPNGTTSSIVTLQLPSNNTHVHNMMKDGNDLWFNGRDPVNNKLATTYYADLTNGEVTLLVEEDSFFVNIVNEQLLLSNMGNMADGISQVGTGVPKSAGQTLTPLLNSNITVDWFMRTDSYAYYSQSSPTKALVQCDPNTWEVLSSCDLPARMLYWSEIDKFSLPSLIGNTFDAQLTGPDQNGIQTLWSLGGTPFLMQSFGINITHYYKIGSVNPSHCHNQIQDFDESDVDCGGLSCGGCEVAQGCISDSDCSSNICSTKYGLCIAPPPVPFTPNHQLWIVNPKFSDNGLCSRKGYLYEMTSDGNFVQLIQLPLECQYFVDAFSGYVTRSSDRDTVVVPCCLDQNEYPQMAGFVEIDSNATVSALRTVQLPFSASLVHNIAKDGNDIWFSARENGVSHLFYANTSTSPVIAQAIVEDDTYFVDITKGELLVSNYEKMTDGIMQVGSSLPKTVNPPLTPLLHQNISIHWFINTANYAYYSQSGPEPALVRCDPNTWAPLYNISLDSQLIHFTLYLYSNGNLGLFANLFSGADAETGLTSYAIFIDDGSTITKSATQDLTSQSTYFKIGSPTPNHCLNYVRDFDETDLNCGGLTCAKCVNTKACLVDKDCTSNYCYKQFVCQDPPSALPFTPGNMLIVDNPQNSGNCAINGLLLEVTRDLDVVQQIHLPVQCGYQRAIDSGYVTLSRDGLSAVIPCCVNQVAGSVGFVEVYFNGTVLPMKTLQLPPGSSVAVGNMAKNGDDIWFTVAHNTYYANLTSNEVVTLTSDDALFVNILANDQLLVSNSNDLKTSLMQVGNGLPTTANQSLTPVLPQNNQLSWFVQTDKYAYYSQFGSDNDQALVRCDPKTWKPLYNITLEFRYRLMSFAVLFNNDSDITIWGTVYDLGTISALIAAFTDNGVNITQKGLYPNKGSDMYYKISSLTPSHCSNNKQDFDETGVDCGGSLCQGCPIAPGVAPLAESTPSTPLAINIPISRAPRERVSAASAKIFSFVPFAVLSYTALLI